MIPLELWALVDTLYRRGMMTPNLWRDPSPSEALAEIREALDTRSSLEGQK